MSSAMFTRLLTAYLLVAVIHRALQQDLKEGETDSLTNALVHDRFGSISDPSRTSNGRFVRDTLRGAIRTALGLKSKSRKRRDAESSFFVLNRFPGSSTGEDVLDGKRNIGRDFVGKRNLNRDFVGKRDAYNDMLDFYRIKTLGNDDKQLSNNRETGDKYDDKRNKGRDFVGKRNHPYLVDLGGKDFDNIDNLVSKKNIGRDFIGKRSGSRSTSGSLSEKRNADRSFFGKRSIQREFTGK